MTINPIIVQIGGGGGLTYEVNSGTRYPDNVTSFTLPPDATNIGDYAFGNFFSLSSITIPAGVTSFGANAFRSCLSLMELTVLSPTPPYIASSSLTGVPANCSIRVPAGSVAAYKAAANWSARAAYITAI